MANIGFKGIDTRQSGTAIVFDASLKDSSGVKVVAGTTNLAIYEIQSDGTFKSYDFADNTFKTTALTTGTAAMVHRTGNNGTVNTGLWSYALATLTGFTRGGVYISQITNSGALPADQERKFVYGDMEGDATASAAGFVQSDVVRLNGSTYVYGGTPLTGASLLTTPRDLTSVADAALTVNDALHSAVAAAVGKRDNTTPASLVTTTRGGQVLATQVVTLATPGATVPVKTV